jgi:hypothetical protein
MLEGWLLGSNHHIDSTILAIGHLRALNSIEDIS